MVLSDGGIFRNNFVFFLTLVFFQQEISKIRHKSIRKNFEFIICYIIYTIYIFIILLTLFKCFLFIYIFKSLIFIFFFSKKIFFLIRAINNNTPIHYANTYIQAYIHITKQYFI